jgi:eukaryotic-like serine/threonine-protein kinase
VDSAGAATATPSLASSPSTDETIVEGDGARSRPQASLGRGDQVGRYLLLDPLGRGAMGQVFRAYDPDLDRQVAIKILHERGGPDARDRLLREAKAMARIHHPNVITVHDAGMHDDAVFIAMEMVDGPPLDHWLATPRTPAETLDVLTDAARGLAAAHAAGVVHRDFKPANVLVTADGRAKVGDFGLAGIEDPATDPSDAGASGHAMGTPAYMSPEHFAGVGIDARSDQFSFAIALYEALHGSRPFSATTYPQLAAQVLGGEPSPAVATRRGSVDGIIRRALSVDPAQRFPTMEALLVALDRARRPVWRTWAAMGALALAVGAALVGGRDAAEEACEPGARRVRAVWTQAREDGVQIGGRDYTSAFTRRARARFEQAVDDYAERWSAAHDESCAAVGPRASRGTAAERQTAQCLENRLDSLRGLVQLASTQPLDAGRVGDLVGTLPAIDDCTASRWVPYPADPEAAAIAAQLDREMARIRRIRLAGHHGEVEQASQALVEAARELGEPYLLAGALRERARVLDDDRAAGPLLDEAIELAIEHGHDRLAAEIVNDIFLVSEDASIGPGALAHITAMARGLAERGGGAPFVLGNLALNEGRLLRRAGLNEAALARERQAELHYASVGNRSAVARARANQLASLLEIGRAEGLIPEIREVIATLEAEDGDDAPTTFQARTLLVGSLAYAGRMHESFEAADAMFEHGRELFTPQSSTLRRLAAYHVIAAANVGRTDVARRTLALMRAAGPLPAAYGLQLDVLELYALEAEGRHEELLRLLPPLELRATQQHDDATAATLAVFAARSLWLLGRHEEARQALTNPVLTRAIDRPELSSDVQADVALLGALSDAPAPPGRTWASLASEDDPIAINRRLAAVVRALETEPDPAATIRRVRDELAASSHAGDVDVQLLDAWLMAHARAVP